MSTPSWDRWPCKSFYSNWSSNIKEMSCKCYIYAYFCASAFQIFLFVCHVKAWLYSTYHLTYLITCNHSGCACVCPHTLTHTHTDSKTKIQNLHVSNYENSGIPFFLWDLGLLSTHKFFFPSWRQIASSKCQIWLQLKAVSLCIFYNCHSRKVFCPDT